MSSNYRSKLRSAARRREEPQSPSEQTQSYDSSSASPRPEASPQRQTSTRANATNQSKESTRARMSGQRTAASQAEASARSEGSTNDQTFLTSPRSPVLSQELESSETQDLSRFFPQTPYNRRKEQAYGDRFIPTRDDAFSARDIYDMELYLSSKSPDEVNTEKYQNRLRMEAYFRSEVLGDFSAATEYASGVHTPRRILSFSTTPSRFRRSPSPTYLVDSPHSWKYRTSPIGEAGTIVLNAHQRALRYINRSSIKILDAPELQDDFYLNLIDWGSNDCLAVGLGNSVYLWNASTSKVTRLCEFADDLITSVSWASTGNRLAVGTDKGHVCLYDTEIGRRIRRWEGHTARTGSLAWNFNVLTSGGRDHKIFHHDIRSATEYFCELTYHVQEVCGLKWNPEGTMLASGGNDNNLLVWDSTSSRLLHRFDDHTAAIKAIAWSPHTRGRLASGGGTADKTIKFWNAISGAAISSHNTGAQVCNLAWSKRADELVSSHGFSSSSERSSNQVIVWKADSMQRLATLSGHTSRVLYMSMSSDCSTVVTGAGDETLRFWEIYSQAEPATRPMDLKLLR